MILYKSFKLKKLLIVKTVIKPVKIWSGAFGCIDKNCSNKFNLIITSYLNIENSTSGELIVNFDGPYIHKEFVGKSMRCHGERRIEQTKIIMIDGVTNTLSSNTIYNREMLTKGLLIIYISYLIKIEMVNCKKYYFS